MFYLAGLTLKSRFVEICSIEAHGDGAAEIAVEALAYHSPRKLLASVAEGKGYVKLWTVADDGAFSNLPNESLTNVPQGI